MARNNRNLMIFEIRIFEFLCFVARVDLTASYAMLTETPPSLHIEVQLIREDRII